MYCTIISLKRSTATTRERSRATLLVAEKIPAIAEQLRAPTQLARATFDKLCLENIFGDEFAKAAKEKPETSRKREWTDAEDSEDRYDHYESLERVRADVCGNEPTLAKSHCSGDWQARPR